MRKILLLITLLFLFGCQSVEDLPEGTMPVGPNPGEVGVSGQQSAGLAFDAAVFQANPKDFPQAYAPFVDIVAGTDPRQIIFYIQKVKENGDGSLTVSGIVDMPKGPGLHSLVQSFGYYFKDNADAADDSVNPGLNKGWQTFQLIGTPARDNNNNIIPNFLDGDEAITFSFIESHEVLFDSSDKGNDYGTNFGVIWPCQCVESENNVCNPNKPPEWSCGCRVNDQNESVECASFQYNGQTKIYDLIRGSGRFVLNNYDFDSPPAGLSPVCIGDCPNNVCGDGVVYQGVEQCDDGNTDDGDGCSSICQTESFCGDGNIDADGPNNVAGDGDDEECDDGANNADIADVCRTNCKNPKCGDNVVDAGESCDDGNVIPGDHCDAVCQIEPFCGDGNVDPGEGCDDGNNVDGDGCSAACTVEAFCGDGNVDAGEQCDDGAANSNAPDADCRTDCSARRCGDNIIDPAGADGDFGTLDDNEGCDDGNNVAGDGCTDCQIEPPDCLDSDDTDADPVPADVGPSNLIAGVVRFQVLDPLTLIRQFDADGLPIFENNGPTDFCSDDQGVPTGGAGTFLVETQCPDDALGRGPQQPPVACECVDGACLPGPSIQATLIAGGTRTRLVGTRLPEFRRFQVFGTSDFEPTFARDNIFGGGAPPLVTFNAGNFDILVSGTNLVDGDFNLGVVSAEDDDFNFVPVTVTRVELLTDDNPPQLIQNIQVT
jgi:cysteine-rich repeat protein